MKPRTVLIAEDSMINRKILAHVLSDAYEVLEAEDGQRALDILGSMPVHPSAIILDLSMPVMDGFEVLDVMRENEAYRNIPVIVATGSNDEASEMKALEKGAWDFITKPYNPGILKFRLQNAIERSKLNLFDQLKRQAEHDPLTGLYNEEKFNQAARKMIDENPEDRFAVIRFDIDRFKQFNQLFGFEEGNRFLCHIAELMKAAATRYPKCVYARLEGDVFAICVSFEREEKLMQAIAVARESIRRYSDRYDIVSVYGLYYVEDRSLSVATMVDRATLAARTCKGNYVKTVAVYSHAMGEKVELEQEIINEMNTALEQEQFCVYYQPKYNLSNNKPCGAEALVRWNHPKKGLIPPGVFIPVLEKNGYVAKVDYFVWEHTCRDLKRWLDAGQTPNPVSVNLSRLNLSNPRIVEIVTDLVQKYQLPPRLLELEITESAYMDNPETMQQLVDGFHQNGFTILMDDFGSGYSSLNTLKQISVDILKIDMKFLPTGENNAKSEKILASMIRMADWIGMPVVCEGVETLEQRNFLESIGCMYVQGYLYGRPMTVKDYEKLISVTEDEQMKRQNAGMAMDLDALLSSDHNIDALLKSIAVPVAIYSYSQGRYDRLRANESFLVTFGRENEKRQLLGCVSPNDAAKLDAAFRQAVATRSGAECESLAIMYNGAARWYRLNLSYIMPTRSGHIVSAVYTEITDAKRVETEMSRIVGILNQSETPKKTMLVVDDSEVSRALLESVFGGEFQILAAKDGREALDLLKIHADELSIILLDMMMPVMDGQTFLSEKTNMEEAARIPVVIISADDTRTTQINMLRSGVNDYITKPFVPEVIYQRVRNVIEYQSRFEELVKEYRRALTMTPDISTRLGETALSAEEVKTAVQMLAPIFDVVRVVDPIDASIITFDANGTLLRQPYSCFKIWHKEKRCENCTGASGLKCNCQMTKYEFIEHNIFYTVSRPIMLVTPTGDKLKVVLEVISHVSDSLLMQGVDGVPIRQILENTHRKIYCDPLTGAYNRRYLYEMRFLNEGRSAPAQSVALIMMDMNHFKQINDTYGHETGDRILVEAVHALQGQIRQTDSIVRYGGDEFLIMLTEYDERHLKKILARLGEAVGTVVIDEKLGTYVTAQFGYATQENFEASRTALDNLIRSADKMMYTFKKGEGLVEHK